VPHERPSLADGGPYSPGSRALARVPLSVVVPVFNERPALLELLREIEAACEEVADTWEVIVVDDGSTDGSRELLERLATASERMTALAFRCNRGKSAALRAGLAATRGDVVVTLDGDGQDDPGSIPQLMAALADGYDHVSGWRVPRHGPRRRAWASWLFNRVTARLTGVPLHDFNSGAKAYRGECARSLAIYGDLHRFIPAIAAELGWRVGEARVAHRPRSHGRSKYGAERYVRAAVDLIGVTLIGRYGNRPLHLFGRLAVAAGVAALVLLGAPAALELAGTNVSAPPLLIAGGLALLCSVQLLAVGLAAEILLAARARPLYAQPADDIAVLGPPARRSGVAAPVASTSRGQPPTPSTR
jgi:hypothetical protein